MPYDTNGRLKKVTNPLGLANEFSYNTEGRMSSEKDHRGKSTAHTYDPFGRETSVTFPDNTTATVSYGMVGGRDKRFVCHNPFCDG